MLLGTRGDKRSRSPFSNDETSTDVQISKTASESTKGSKRKVMACTFDGQNKKTQLETAEACNLSVNNAKGTN